MWLAREGAARVGRKQSARTRVPRWIDYSCVRRAQFPARRPLDVRQEAAVLTSFRELVERIRYDDPWDWEVEAEDDAVASSFRTRDGHRRNDRRKVPKVALSRDMVEQQPGQSVA